MRKIDSNSELMTTREVGEVLGEAVRTVQLWVVAVTALSPVDFRAIELLASNCQLSL